jgi:hypothetical protein
VAAVLILVEFNPTASQDGSSCDCSLPWAGTLGARLSTAAMQGPASHHSGVLTRPCSGWTNLLLSGPGQGARDSTRCLFGKGSVISGDPLPKLGQHQQLVAQLRVLHIDGRTC